MLVDRQKTPLLFEVKEVAVEVGQRMLLRGVSFQLTEGQLGVIRGENGVGKTSLLRILAGFSSPPQGKVLWQNESIYDFSSAFALDTLWKNACSYLSHRLGFKLSFSVEENLYWMASLAGNDNVFSNGSIGDDTNRAANATDLIGILDALSLRRQRNICAKSLSAGQQKRLAFARLLIEKRPVWILDEVFASVDKMGIDCFREIIEDHTRKGGMALITSHQEVFYSPSWELTLSQFSAR